MGLSCVKDGLVHIYLEESMFILPYIYKQTPKKAGIILHTASLFLEKGGTQLLFMEEANVDFFLHENGLHVGHRRFKSHGILFLEVDSGRTNLKEFYSFHEKGTQLMEVWRTFTWVTDEQGEDIWNTIQQMEHLAPLSNKSVLQLIQAIKPMV